MNPLDSRVTLDDRYTLAQGRALMSGIQALVRLPMLQQVRDTAAGLHTAGFISGYRGSPLGGYDQALWAAQRHLAAHDIVFQPGVNEELAATAVWGTQQLDLNPQHRRFDGVFGLWYGKGPGVDRCADVFKHANLAGTSRHGGVIAVAGDDHVARSSTAAHQSDHLFKACGLPVFFPSSVQEILDLGLHAFALSRYAGVWSAMKTIQEVVESSMPVEVGADRVRIVLPEDFPMPEGGVHIRWPDSALAQEARLMDHKWYATLAYIRANRLNQTVIRGPTDRIGLIASGKAWNDTRQALRDLGLDDATCRAIGLRLHKVSVVWPLEAASTREFAEGLQEILVIEEKRQVIEYQLKEELYNWRADVRPDVLGKFDEPEGDHSGGEWSRPDPSQHWLLRAQADLNPALIARAIARRLNRIGVPEDVRARMLQRLDVIAAKEHALTLATPPDGPAARGERPPWFCSGCPHNTSTRVPEGSRALAGIGCHYMAIWMDRRTQTFSQMGGEGVAWVGQAPFTTEPHVFANLGDGTYFHSGLLAIRQSIAAGVNITYKILFNGAVAMTGGQPVDGTLEIPEMCHELRAEGVRSIVIVSEEPALLLAPAVHHRVPSGVEILPRDQLDAVQRRLRALTGCTVLIYDQTCATEKRRRRKRGTMPDPARQVVIHEGVCEGCGDCSTQSNCLSVEPVETEFGRKRRINPSSCNKDFSCLKGFCPSFVTIEGGKLRRPTVGLPAGDRPGPAELPEPTRPQVRHSWGIVIAGIGGTGVITLGQLLGMAAHLDGQGVVTQDAAGLAQKGGATWSHVQVASTQEVIATTKVDLAEADLVLACDAIVAAQPTTLALMGGQTAVVLNTHDSPTAALMSQRDWRFPAEPCRQAIEQALGPNPLSGRLTFVDAERLSTALLGDAIYANLLMLGCAWQRGLVPVSRAALHRAIELNGTQAERNRQAFEWGRVWAHDPAALQDRLNASSPAVPIQFMPRANLGTLIERRTADLIRYQDAAYARRYRDLVEQVRAAEARLGPATPLTEAVARNFHTLMAYKDEYEVARLLTDPAFAARIDAMIDGPYRLVHHLAPPLWPGRDAEGRPLKRAWGPWIRPVLRVLARLRGLRGTPFDPFGWTAERCMERMLITEYREALLSRLTTLDAATLPEALEIARLPEQIRGFGPIKARAAEAARAIWRWR